jgi:hypothetical protein
MRDSWTSWPLKMGPMGCARNVGEKLSFYAACSKKERRSHLHRGRSLKSPLILFYYKGVHFLYILKFQLYGVVWAGILYEAIIKIFFSYSNNKNVLHVSLNIGTAFTYSKVTFLSSRHAPGRHMPDISVMSASKYENVNLLFNYKHEYCTR